MQKEHFFNLILALMGPLFIIGMLEVSAFFWERSQANGLYAWELVASRRIDLVPIYGDQGGYTLMEPGREYTWQDIPVKINKHGLRGPEFALEKQPGTYRILNLGDSIAMGWGVGLEDTYGYQLQELLREIGPADSGIEVINAGVPGWNLENELAYLKAEGIRYNPDLILLDLTLVNDVYGANALAGPKQTKITAWLRENTYFWPFLSIQFQWLQARRDGQERIDVINPPSRASSYFPTDPEAEKWAELTELIVQMNEIALANEARFMVLLFPLEYQVIDPNYSTLPQDVLTERLQAAGIQAIDLLEPFQIACAEAPGGPCVLEDRFLFADVWMHPSAYGNELTANEVYRTILDSVPELAAN